MTLSKYLPLKCCRNYRNGKKLIDFVLEFNSKSKADSKKKTDDDDDVEEKTDLDNNNNDDDNDEEGIGEEFIKDLVI